MRKYKTKNYKFHQHKSCEFFPCHKGISKEEFNCLFCYCPLYMLGKDCGGDFKITNGRKDCTPCTKPHQKDGGFEHVMSKMSLVLEKGSDWIPKKEEEE